MKRSKEDSSCSLLSHFWSTFQSPFSICYIPFQSSGSQESNASNHVRFGAEMRKIWPSEDNCSRLVRNSHNTFQIRTSPCVVRILLCFFRLHFRSFLMYFFVVISFLILVTNQLQAFAFVKTI